MSPRLPRAPFRRSWWWLFGLFIAVPAVVLAMLGMRAIRAEDVERQRQHRERQGQVAAQIRRLADASLSTALDRVVTDASRSETTGPAADARAWLFEVDSAGVVAFPAERLVAPPADAVPFARPLALPDSEAAAIERVRAAEAQGRTTEALALYRGLPDNPTLRPWIDWRLLVLSGASPVMLAEQMTARVVWESDATTPSGVPLAVAALNEMGGRPGVGPKHLAAAAERTLAALRGGRWPLSLDQRRAYERELLRLLGSVPEDDLVARATVSHLEDLEQVAEHVRTALAASHGLPPRAHMVGDADLGHLLIWIRPRSSTDAWRGVAVPDHEASALFATAIGPLLEGQPFTASLSDRTRILWAHGSTVPRDVEVPGQPLETVSGWSLSVTGTALDPLTGSSRLLSYARVLFPIAVLACGLVLAGWLMRREIALAERQSTFVAAVTHEFKSPLTSIRLLMERLADGRIGTEESAARYHAAIGAETERLENLVNRLLESQKLQSGQRTYDLQPSSLQTMVRETVDRLRPQAEAKDIQISARVIGAVPDLPLDVQAMFDAVRNLIDNAIKYSPAHTEITVALDIDGPDVRLTVSDQGVGIDPADATRVFEPFFRGRRGERVNVQGTGLGLSLVRATAEAHGGTVAVEDNGGRGSRFILRVPRPHPPVDLPASTPLEPEHL